MIVDRYWPPSLSVSFHDYHLSRKSINTQILRQFGHFYCVHDQQDFYIYLYKKKKIIPKFENQKIEFQIANYYLLSIIINYIRDTKLRIFPWKQQNTTPWHRFLISTHTNQIHISPLEQNARSIYNSKQNKKKGTKRPQFNRTLLSFLVNVLFYLVQRNRHTWQFVLHLQINQNVRKRQPPTIVYYSSPVIAINVMAAFRFWFTPLHSSKIGKLYTNAHAKQTHSHTTQASNTNTQIYTQTMDNIRKLFAEGPLAFKSSIDRHCHRPTASKMKRIILQQQKKKEAKCKKGKLLENDTDDDDDI